MLDNPQPHNPHPMKLGVGYGEAQAAHVNCHASSLKGLAVSKLQLLLQKQICQNPFSVVVTVFITERFYGRRRHGLNHTQPKHLKDVLHNQIVSGF